MKDINYYIKAFSKLKRAYQHGGAPHKPILLLSIIEGIKREEISSNKIFITPELIMCFREFWHNLVNTPHQLNFALPFYHMRTEVFWKIVSKPGCQIALTSSHSVKSLSALNESLFYAEIDFELFDLMKNRITNELLRKTIIEVYFSNQVDPKIEYSLINNIKKQILTEEQTQYKSRIDSLQENSNKEEVEEDLFVRGSLFKREIPKIYNYTCAISGLRIVSVTNTQMVDACHIIPFSISKDDTIGNGISLSPNLHRAFDRGLISISNDYRVIVSKQIIENETSFSITQLNGTQLLLPQNKLYFPRKESLDWHRCHKLLV